MKAWASMIPVEGDSSARSAASAGSSSRACRPLSQTRSVTPLASAWALSAASLPTSRLVHRHQELAASLVGHAEVIGERVEHRLALDAEPGLVEAGRIIDAGMDDFAIARTHTLADSAFFLDDDDLAPGERQRPRHGEPNDARADDETFG